MLIESKPVKVLINYWTNLKKINKYYIQFVLLFFVSINVTMNVLYLFYPFT